MKFILKNSPPLDVTPRKTGNTLEHFAYALKQLHQTRKKCGNPYKLKNIFFSIMQQTNTTTQLLKLLPKFKFASSTIETELKNACQNTLTQNDLRIPSIKPICPILLEPIQNCAIKFKNDPNWYDLKAIHQWMVNYDNIRSPMMHVEWDKIDLVYAYGEANELRQLTSEIQKKLAEPAKTKPNFFQRFSFFNNRSSLVLDLISAHHEQFTEEVSLNYYTYRYMDNSW